MRASIVLSVWAALSAVNAAPATDPETTGFAVAEEDAGPRVRHPALEMAQAFRKYGYEPPEDVSIAEKSAQAGKKGRVTAYPEPNDREYHVKTKVGSQYLQLTFDTGSSDLWVFSTEQPASQRSGHTAYKCSKPKLAGESWAIKYADGSGAHGNIVKDRVQVGSIVAPNQAVECAKSVSKTFIRDKHSDGLLGLAFDKLNTAKPRKVSTFFSNVKGRLAAPLFTAALGHFKPGEYTFGYIDGSKHSGSISYAHVNTGYGVWQFSAGYAIGSGSNHGATSWIADTGTSIIFAHAAIVKAYYAKINGVQYNSQYGGYTFPCSESIPSFSIIVGGVRHTTPAAYLVYGRLEGSSYCFGGLQNGGSLPFGILGDTFLSSQYVVFDSRGPRIGFGHRK